MSCGLKQRTRFRRKKFRRVWTKRERRCKPNVNGPFFSVWCNLALVISPLEVEGFERERMFFNRRHSYGVAVGC